MDVVTYYSIPADKEYAYMYDTLINKGGETGNLSNRIALTNKGDDGGFMFPLVYPKGASNIDAYNSIVGTYGKSYCTTLALPGKVEKGWREKCRRASRHESCWRRRRL